MSIFHIFLFSLALLSYSAAKAEGNSPYTGGMKYTTISKSKIAPRTTSDMHIKQKSLSGSALPEDKTAEDTPANKIWNKYKALAAGQAEDTPADTSEKNEQTPQEEENAKAEALPPEAVGLVSLIEKYEQNKKRQSQMRSLDVARPKAPEKPEIDSPESAEH